MLIAPLQILDPGLDDVMEELEEIEHHFHNREYWFGSDGRRLGAGSLGMAAFQMTSAATDYGTAVAILTSADTPVAECPGATSFDCRRFLVTAQGVSEHYSLRFIWSNTDAATGIAHGQYTETQVFNATGAGQSLISGSPQDLLMPRLPVGTAVWCQSFNLTASTIDIKVGIHLYPALAVTTS